MTNKPMLSVERELLESLAAYVADSPNAVMRARSVQLRALLDRPETPYVPKAGWSFKYVENGVIVIRNGEDWTIIKPGDGPIYEQFLYRFCEEQLNNPAAQHQGEPVAWVECSPAWLKAGGDCATAPRICVGREGISHLHPAHSNAEQPAPVADQTQCEECKGWGYHENHHEGGGTECGECGGSGNATVAAVMVMPDRMKVEPFTTIDRGSKNYKAGYNAALAEVARLNGVKP